ncbi:MAG: Amuc_1100 family pilus-like protein [Verrucomicrobiales bacterium]
MDWIRENKMLAGILGVIVAGSLGLGYVLYNTWTSYTEKKDQYLALGNQIAQLKSLPLSPTAANLAEKKKLVDEYAKNVNQLGVALRLLQDAVAPKSITDTQFQAKLKERVIEIKKMAAALEVQIPTEFAFGFDPYIGVLPPNEAATELSGYLDSIESIVKLAMVSKVASIDMIERSQIAEEAGGSGDAAKSKSKSKSKGKDSTKGTAGATTTASIAEKRQISMLVTLDQGALQTLMSKLANPGDMPYFASVRVFRVENQAQEGPIKSGVVIPSPESTPETKEEVGSEIRPPKPDPVDSVPVMGLELLKAQLDIDLVKFLPIPTGASPSASAAR